jgi:hypothetical protein
MVGKNSKSIHASEVGYLTLPAEDCGSLVLPPGGSETSLSPASRSVSLVSGVCACGRHHAGFLSLTVMRLTDGHEAEAEQAQLRKRPNRLGLFFLRVLGFRGEVAPPTVQGGHAGPSHKHSVHHEHSTPGE